MREPHRATDASASAVERKVIDHTAAAVGGSRCHDPVPDFRGSFDQFLGRHCAHVTAVVAFHRANEIPVESLVYFCMAQAARSDNHDAFASAVFFQSSGESTTEEDTATGRR